jgi:hypothetical protein
VNECWLSYWVQQFARHQYLPVDRFRPLIWTNTAVPFWYRQNLLLFIHRDRLPATYQPPPMIDLVHPDLLMRTTRELQRVREHQVSGREALSLLAHAVRRRFGG